jgi:phosphoglycolate phosphatase
MKQGLIFDLDGTLWDATAQITPSWNEVFARYPEYGAHLTLGVTQSLMGKTMEEIAAVIFPKVEEAKRNSIIKECCDFEITYLEKYGGVLYPRLKETLAELAGRYLLFIVSNSQDGYVQTFLKRHELGGYFADIEMSGRTGLDKGGSIRLLAGRNGLERAACRAAVRLGQLRLWPGQGR